MSNRPWRRSPEDFGKDLEQVLGWMVRYMSDASERSVWSRSQPGEVGAQIPIAPPTEPEPLEEVMRDLQQIIEPGLVRWDAPGWMAWFPSNSHPDAILGDLLASVAGQQGMLWTSSPACTELETRMLEWLRTAMGLPACFAEGGPGGGVIQDTASSAVLACMVAARDRATQRRATREGGSACGGLVAYASEQSHSSVLKAAGICGIGRDNLRLVPTDGAFKMDVESLAQMMRCDLEADLQPCFCAATVGTTGCGAIDPVAAIAEVCRSHGAWLHVDAAWAGTAALSARHRDTIVGGASKADSWNCNPHKWMGASFDCSCLWLADRGPLIDAMSVEPEYLRNAASERDGVIDYRDWHIQLGRRFRAMKLWVLLRRTGVSALANMVDFHVSLAEMMEQRLGSHPKIELAAPRSLSLLCIRHVDGDAATRQMIDAVNTDDRFAVTHCTLDDRLAMRIAVGALSTERADIETFSEHLLAAT